MPLSSKTALLSLIAVAILAGSPSSAQEIIDLSEDLDFDRPESWAMKYFASVSLFTGMGTPDHVEPGDFRLALECGNVPSLSEDERRVGFTGDKVEDLNRTSFFGRITADIGLPGDMTLGLGWSPPVDVDGLEPNLFFFSLARPIYDQSWRLGLRLHGQTGSVDGDLTCPADVSGVDDPQVNPLRCHEPSNDEQEFNSVGLEFSASPKVGERWEPHFAVSANYMDLELEIDAVWGPFVDMSVLSTSGWTYSASAGVAFLLSERWRLAGEVFYSPLDVVRETSAGSQNDPLFNVRGRVSYKIR